MNLPYDISRCANHDCPIRLECLRFTDKGNPIYQVYTRFEPDTDETCEHQIPVKGNKQ